MTDQFPFAPAWASAIRTLGVTGTNGKTSTVSFAAAALGSRVAPVACVTTVGSWVGTEALGVSESYDEFLAAMARCRECGGSLAAIELTSAALAAGFMRAWPCQAGVFTNLSFEHMESHGTPEHYLASKAQLFRSLPAGGAAVLNACDPASELLREVLDPEVQCKSFAVASRGAQVLPADLAASELSVTRAGTAMRLHAAPDSGWPDRLTIRALGEIFAENALAALLAAVALGVSPAQAARRVAETPAPPGRFEIVLEDPLVVIDYAHTPDALARTLDTARQLCGGTIHLVLGAGGGRSPDKRRPLGAAAAAADHVVLTADNPRNEDPARIAAELRSGMRGSTPVQTILDRFLAIEAALRAASPSDLVLIAGKGHESGQITRAGSRPFSDRDAVRQIAGARLNRDD